MDNYFPLACITDSLRCHYGLNTDLVRIESVMPPYCTRVPIKEENWSFLEKNAVSVMFPELVDN